MYKVELHKLYNNNIFCDLWENHYWWSFAVCWHSNKLKNWKWELKEIQLKTMLETHYRMGGLSTPSSSFATLLRHPLDKDIFRSNKELSAVYVRSWRSSCDCFKRLMHDFTRGVLPGAIYLNTLKGMMQFLEKPVENNFNIFLECQTRPNCRTVAFKVDT